MIMMVFMIMIMIYDNDDVYDDVYDDDVMMML
jgi:hypothetical protein